MKPVYLAFGFLFFSVTLFAQSQDNNAPTQPTKASKPLPSLHETKNPDTVLSEKVQKEINASSVLKGQAISAASVNGNIILQGSVDSKAIESHAIETVKKVSGVRKVTSQLTIKILRH